jgi:guanylate kinase
MCRGRVIIVSGPSGVGKGTVLQKLLVEAENVELSISATTRPQRPTEQDTVDYFFLEDHEFDTYVQNDAFLEWCNVHQHRYGTLAEVVEKQTKKGVNVILEIDTKGAIKVKEKLPDALLIFIMPPSMEVLRERLETRNTEAQDVIEKRLNEAKNEIADSKHYDFVIKNYTIPDTVAQIKRIIEQEQKEQRT